MLELRARFDESQSRMEEMLEMEGVKVLIGLPNVKGTRQALSYKKRSGNKIISMVLSARAILMKNSPGLCRSLPVDEQQNIMADINAYSGISRVLSRALIKLRSCKTLMVCPINMRKAIDANDFGRNKKYRAKRNLKDHRKINSLSDVRPYPEIIQRSGGRCRRATDRAVAYFAQKQKWKNLKQHACNQHSWSISRTCPHIDVS